MTKKRYFFIILIIILTGLMAYFYLTEFYFDKDEEKIYTAADFPNALEVMDEETLQISLDDLNKQYRKLEEDDHIYIRWINVGLLKKRLQDYPGAEEAWQNAISHNPNQALAFGNLADFYLFDLGQYEKAEEYYQKVLSMRTDNYNYYFGLAALYRYNMTEKAHLIEGLMLGAAEKVPAEAENYYMYLADYFYREGNNSEKSKHYTQKTLELNPDLRDQLPDW